MQTEERVQWVEKLCDYIEEEDPYVFNTTLFRVSIPATCAALRAFYYVDKNRSFEALCKYEVLYYLFDNNREEVWNKMDRDEKRCLLMFLRITDNFVYVPR